MWKKKMPNNDWTEVVGEVASAFFLVLITSHR